MYQCTSCGGRLKFDIASHLLKCEHCSSLFGPYSVEDGPSATESRLFDVTLFSCPQCGGEIYSTDETAAGFCSFCGASTVLNSRLAAKERPALIIPFYQTKEDCKAVYEKAMKSAIFAPKELKDKTYIDGFRGIYMPYWVYHFKHNGTFSLPASKTYRQGDYIITDHYQISGELDASYDGLSHDASASFADNISERIAPYDTNDLQDFSPSFLSGFYADVSDINSTTYAEDIEKITLEESLDQITDYHMFHGLKITDKTNRLADISQQQSVEMAMFPVWFLSYRKNNRVSYATVNGQTGKVVLDIPVDLRKFVIGSLLLALPLFFMLNTMFTLRPPVTLGIVMAIAVITELLYHAEINSIAKRETYKDDVGFLVGKRNKMQSLEPYIHHEPASKTNILLVILNLFALACSLVIQITQPVADSYYYGAIFASMVVEFFLLLDLIRKYNILSTRPLPQFKHQGGDDRA